MTSAPTAHPVSLTGEDLCSPVLSKDASERFLLSNVSFGKIIHSAELFSFLNGKSILASGLSVYKSVLQDEYFEDILDG